MIFPLKIALILWEMALFHTNFNYKFFNLWSRVEGHNWCQKLCYILARPLVPKGGSLWSLLRFLFLSILRPAPGIMFTWLAVLVLKDATVLLLSTTFRFWLLSLLLLLLTLLFMFRTRVRRPVAKAAKSRAFWPLIMGPGGQGLCLPGLSGRYTNGITCLVSLWVLFTPYSRRFTIAMAKQVSYFIY